MKLSARANDASLVGEASHFAHEHFVWWPEVDDEKNAVDHVIQMRLYLELLFLPRSHLCKRRHSLQYSRGKLKVKTKSSRTFDVVGISDCFIFRPVFIGSKAKHTFETFHDELDHFVFVALVRRLQPASRVQIILTHVKLCDWLKNYLT